MNAMKGAESVCRVIACNAWEYSAWVLEKGFTSLSGLAHRRDADAGKAFV